MTGRRVRRPTLFSLWRKARRENSAASRLLGTTSLRFALHGWQRAFASGADGGSITPKQEEKPALDPNAKREFKAIRVPFNEFEYSKLEEVANKTGRTKLNVIRWAILKLAEDVQEGHQ